MGKQKDNNTPSAKAGLPPGTLMHLGQKKMEKSLVSIMRYTNEEFFEILDASVKDVKEQLLLPGTIWVNVDGIHETELIEQIGSLVNLHPLLKEDILNTFQRPKYEDYDDLMYLNLKMLGISPNHHTIVSEQVGFVLGATFILSFQEQRGDLFDPIRGRLRENKGLLRSKGADYLFYRFVDTIIDNYFLVTEHISVQNEKLEDKVLKDPSSEILKEIQGVKRALIKIRKAVVPLREAVNSIYRESSNLIHEDTQPYLRNVYDHITQVLEWSETQREIIGGVMDLYLSEISNKMNQVMKTLTVIATIFIPLTFVAGVYGMNFEVIPELHWKYGYLAFWGVMVLMVFVMVRYFKKKNWF